MKIKDVHFGQRYRYTETAGVGIGRAKKGKVVKSGVAVAKLDGNLVVLEEVVKTFSPERTMLEFVAGTGEVIESAVRTTVPARQIIGLSDGPVSDANSVAQFRLPDALQGA